MKLNTWGFEDAIVFVAGVATDSEILCGDLLKEAGRRPPDRPSQQKERHLSPNAAGLLISS